MSHSSFSMEAIFGFRLSFGQTSRRTSGNTCQNSVNHNDDSVCNDENQDLLLPDTGLPSPREVADAQSLFSPLLFFKEREYALDYSIYQRARSSRWLFVVTFTYLSYLLVTLYMSWLLYHYSPWAAVAVTALAYTSLVPGLLIILSHSISATRPDSDFTRYLQLHVVPRLETLWLISTCFFYASGLTLKISMGKCPDSNNFMEVLACDTEVQQHKLGEDYALLITIVPALLSMVL